MKCSSSAIFLSVLLSLLLISNISVINAEPACPKYPENVDVKIKSNLETGVQGIIEKFAKPQISGELDLVIEESLKNYPDADKMRLIETLLGVICNTVIDNREFTPQDKKEILKESASLIYNYTIPTTKSGQEQKPQFTETEKKIVVPKLKEYIVQIDEQQTPVPNSQFYYENFKQTSVKKIFTQWNIEKGGCDFSIVEDELIGKCLKLEKKKRWGDVYMDKDFKGLKGTVMFEARLRAQGIVAGDKGYKRGKFRAKLYDSKGNDLCVMHNYYPNADIGPGNTGWVVNKFKITDLEGSEIVRLKLGFQEAKGILFIDEIKGYYVQD